MSSIREAFDLSYFTGPRVTALHLLIDAHVRTKPKLTRDQQRGWSANLTYRTYNSLKNQGVLL